MSLGKAWRILLDFPRDKSCGYTSIIEHHQRVEEPAWLIPPKAVACSSPKANDTSLTIFDLWDLGMLKSVPVVLCAVSQ